jgi:nitrate reductase beta subunit
MPTFQERFVLPPLGRELAIESSMDPFAAKREGGFGFRSAPERRW